MHDDGAMSRLLEANDSVLLVIDVQPDFVDRVEDDRRAGMVERIAFLAATARHAGIPVIATVESPERWGELHPQLAPHLTGAPVLRKEVFGLGDDPAVLPIVEATGRRTAVLTGLETDVCVAHSALSLLDRGWRVICVGDAVASPGAAHDAGIERMSGAGVPVLCAKQVHYEWLRTVAAAQAFRAAHPEFVEPPGVLL
jgi:nicotinamidase-related amidase